MREILVSRPRLDEDLIEDYGTYSMRKIRRLRQLFSQQDEQLANEVDVVTEIAKLKKQITIIQKNIEKQQLQKTQPKRKGEIIYNQLSKYLELEYSGKVIAIDVEKKKVVGVGDSIDEAYTEAIEKTKKKRFYFKKVGQTKLTSL